MYPLDPSVFDWDSHRACDKNQYEWIRHDWTRQLNSITSYYNPINTDHTLTPINIESFLSKHQILVDDPY